MKIRSLLGVIGLALVFGVPLAVAQQVPHPVSGPSTSTIGDYACWGDALGQGLVDCGTGLTSGGAAGGDLSGSYPNPTVTGLSHATVTPSGASVASSPAALFGRTVNVLDYGAKCDGTTDDTAAFAAAFATLTNGGTLLLPPDAACYSATGITVPPYATLQGQAFGPANGPAASIITCPNTVAVCVKANGAAGTNTLLPVAVRDVSIVGAGTVNAASVGLEFFEGYNVSTRDVKVSNFGTCALWHGGNLGGLASFNSNFQASKCDTNYLDIDGWAEIQFDSGRIGDNGSGDYAANDFVLFTNTGCTTAGCGPNTIKFFGTQFNPGNGAAPSCFFNWAGSNGDGVTTEFRFIGIHAEVSQAVAAKEFCSDATVTNIQQLQVIGSQISNDNSTDATAVFALNSATALSDATFANDSLGGNSQITLNAQPVSGNGLEDDHFNSILNVGAWTIDAPAGNGSTLYVSNSYLGTLTLSGSWSGKGALFVTGSTIGSLTGSQTSGMWFANDDGSNDVRNGVIGTNCTGTPTSSFSVSNGIVGHC